MAVAARQTRSLEGEEVVAGQEEGAGLPEEQTWVRLKEAFALINTDHVSASPSAPLMLLHNTLLKNPVGIPHVFVRGCGICTHALLRKDRVSMVTGLHRELQSMSGAEVQSKKIRGAIERERALLLNPIKV